MLDYQLFLGFPVDSLFVKELQKIPEKIRIQYISKENEKNDFLQERYQEEMLFIGKCVGEISSLQQLKLAENNIYSILKKLVPHFPYQEAPLYLFSTPKTH